MLFVNSPIILRSKMESDCNLTNFTRQLPTGYDVLLPHTSPALTCSRKTTDTSTLFIPKPANGHSFVPFPRTSDRHNLRLATHFCPLCGRIPKGYPIKTVQSFICIRHSVPGSILSYALYSGNPLHLSIFSWTGLHQQWANFSARGRNQ
jgi:hypothetical protein